MSDRMSLPQAIGWKRTPVVAGIAAIALLFAGVLLAVISEHSYQAAKANDLAVQARILASTVSAAVAFDDVPAARDNLAALDANDAVEAAAVYDADGYLFASYTRGTARLPAGRVAVHDPEIRGESIDVVVPVEAGGSGFGTVYLSVVSDPIERRVARYGFFALLVVMAALVVAVLGIAHGALAGVNLRLERANQDLRQEIAEREKAEDALRQSQKMEAVGQLTGGIAHDFNNILQGIVGSLVLIEKRVADGRTTEVNRFMTTAMTAANRAAALIQRLLAFSRRQPLMPKALNTNQLALSMDDLLRRTLGTAIELRYELGNGIWTTFCDQNQLESAILNLAINARDAMPSGGLLTIATGNSTIDGARAARDPSVRAGEYVRLCVGDNGVGMTADVVSRAFEPFFTTKALGQGTGLGLSMIYGFAQQSGGGARIYSRVDGGTCVAIYLPRHMGAPAPEPRAVATSPVPVGKAEQVLVVEDDPIVRDLVVDTLNDLGYRTLEAADGSSAVELLRTSVPIDLLVTDIGLPGLNGKQVADAGRAQRPGLKVLFMTGYAETATSAKGFLAPGMEMMTKPFQLDDMAARVRKLLENGKA